MAITIIDGFDLYNGLASNLGLQSKWVVANTTYTSMDTGRFGVGQCLKFDGTATTSTCLMTRSLPATVSAFASGVAVKISDLADIGAAFAILISGESTTPHAQLTVNDTGYLTARRTTSYTGAGVALGTTATQVIFQGVWHYVEWEVVIHDTTGSFKVWVDGVQVLNLTNVDTRNAGTGIVNRVGICPFTGKGGACYFDDFYVTNSAVRLGECRIDAIRPNADVVGAKDFTPSTGTDHYALVDESVANGDTDYVSGTTVGHVDRFTHAGLGVTPSAIHAVQVSAFGKKTDAATRSINLQVKSGATTSDGSSYNLAADYAKFERILETDPNTAAAWGASGVNALEFGVKVAA